MVLIISPEWVATSCSDLFCCYTVADMTRCLVALIGSGCRGVLVKAKGGFLAFCLLRVSVGTAYMMFAEQRFQQQLQPYLP
jgi:hypothetical protein